MSADPSPEEKKPNPILNELDKEASASPAADAGSTPPLQPLPPEAEPAVTLPAEPPPPAAEAVPAPPKEAVVPEPAEPLAANDSSQELVTDAMRRLDDILTKIKEKKADPAP